jgi:hypothetical protein
MSTVRAIAGLGAAAATPEILPGLTTTLSDSRRLRQEVVEAFRSLGGAAATLELLSVLVAGLHDPDVEICRDMTLTVGSLGGAAATPEILASLPRAKLARSRQRGALLHGPRHEEHRQRSCDA